MEGKIREFQAKLGRVRRMMREKRLFGCYMKRQDSFAWLTCGGVNYVAAGEVGNCGLLVTENGLYAITNNIEGPRMEEEEGLKALGFEMREGLWYDREFEERTLTDICQEKPWARDYGQENIYEEVQRLRFSLLPEEIERYRTGGRMVSRLVEEAASSLRPGQTEWDGVSQMAVRAAALGLEPLSLFCAADERICRYRHAVAVGRCIRERVQIGGNFKYKGLVIGLTRYVNFVPVSEKLKRQYRDNVEIGSRMIEATAPGVSWQVPLCAGKEAYERLGYKEEFEKHHQGGPIGYAARDFRVDFGHKSIIEANQAFCWNPSITGTKSEDTVIAAEEGPLFITGPCLFPALETKINGHTVLRPDILEL